MIDERTMEEEIIAKAFEDAVNSFPKEKDHSNYVIGILTSCVAKLNIQLEKMQNEAS